MLFEVLMIETNLVEKFHNMDVVGFIPEVLAKDLVYGAFNPQCIVDCNQAHAFLKHCLVGLYHAVGLDN